MNMVTSEGQVGLLPEGCYKPLATLRPPELGASEMAEFGEVLGAEVAQFVVLPMRPQVFDWVQLRRIGRQKLQVYGAVLALDILTHQTTAVRLQPVPDDQQLPVG